MQITLNGQWNVNKRGEATTIPAAVPGCIHTDLLAAGAIDDPFYRDNEARQMWIGETDWVYSRTFIVDPTLLQHEQIRLRCEGLDTLATITLNDALIGHANNQFRTWEFDVKPYLLAGENTIHISFAAVVPYITAEQHKHALVPVGRGARPNPLDHHDRIEGGNHVRKSQCNFGWDWGPMCATAGIWRPISLVAFNTARLTDVHITQDHSQAGNVGMQVSVDIETTTPPQPSPESGAGAALTARVSIWDDGQLVCQEDVPIRNTHAQACLAVTNPKLWWPNDLGDQPLYMVTIELRHAQTVLDTAEKRIGLRTLALDRHPDQWGESFQFVVNGKPFFAKGANWIPADTFVSRLTKGQYEDLLKSSADAHFNMLRVWGGGIYEDDAFYDLCDQYGICLWHDFMFACSAYPAYDDAFLANVRAEAIDNVKRLRHHPSLALWCGNNELEQGGMIGDAESYMMSWTDYRRLFDELLPGIVHTLDPQRSYWPSSPHSPHGDRRNFNNPTCGDAHLWDVWHGRKPFEWYRTCEHRFNSEFGFQSFPEPEVVKSYTAPAERNITNAIMEWHQRSGIGNTTILQYMLSWFQLPTSFDMLLWASQILHGMAMKYAVEHWRRSMPRGMGTLYWQINDCWPVASWASIDFYGNWKALHYMARDFFAPLLISAVEDPKTGNVEIHVTSDLLQPTAGEIRWTLTDTRGQTLASNTLACTIPACASQRAIVINVTDAIAEYDPRKLLLWLELVVADQVVSHNLAYFTRPKYLDLQAPQLTTRIEAAAGHAFTVTIDAHYPAFWVWAELPGTPATYSNRFFHLRPGHPAIITIQPKTPMTVADVAQRLRVRSLLETWAISSEAIGAARS